MTEPATPANTPPPATAQHHVPLARVLVGGITLLILLSVGSVAYQPARGDREHLAARLESFAKQRAIDDDCVTSIGGATRQAAGAALSGDIATEHLGEVPVRGREGRVEVYRLRG